MRKFFSFVSLAVIVIAILFVFNSGAFAEQKNIKVVSTETDPNSRAVAKEIIAAYEKEHPNVKVDYEEISYGEIVKRSMAAAMSGESLGVQLTWSELSYELAGRGLMEPLDDVIDAIGRNDFVQSAILSYKGKEYMVPYFKTGYVMYYRDDLFKKHGIEPPKSWDELLVAAEKLTEDTDGDGKIDRYGFVYPCAKDNGTAIFFLAYAYMKGGSILTRDGQLNWDSQGVKDTFKFWKKLRQFTPPGISEYRWGEQISMYHSDAVAITMYPGRLLMRTKRNNPEIFAVTKAIHFPTPTGDPAERQTIAEVAGISIMKGTKNLDLAKDFVKFFMKGDRYIKWCNTVPGHFIPVLKSALNNPAYWDDPLLKEKKDVIEVIVEASKYGRHPLYEWDNKVNLKANRLYTTYLLVDSIQEIILNDADIDKTLDKYGKKMKQEMKKIKE